jgi:hypothetical protein
VSTSILTDTKKALGIVEADTVFDSDIVMHINSVFSILKQYGVGPDDGFEIGDKVPTWADFIGPNKAFNFVKSYMYLKVRLLFDPPNTSYLIQSCKEQAAEYEWRISTEREQNEWVNPNPAPVTESVIDGGTP